MTQLELADMLLSRLDRQFADYHARNPHVFGLFRQFAEQARAAGYRHFGAKAIMERVRWQVAMETRDQDGFKINNSYTSRYVRLLEQRYPKFIGFFQKRKLRS